MMSVGMLATAPIRRLLARLARDKSGAWMMEFALITPVFLGGSLAALEYSHMVLSRQKMERVAANSADLFARNTIPPNENQVNDIFLSVGQIGKPLDLKPHGRVIVTGVMGISDATTGAIQNKILWQRCYGDLTGQTSSIGPAPEPGVDPATRPGVTLPGGVMLSISQMSIASETFYRYQPLISAASLPGLQANEVFRERSLFRVRGAPYTAITPMEGVTPTPC